MSGATRLHAPYNDGSREAVKGAEGRQEGGARSEANKLREEACVNDFGRFVHTGDAHCNGLVHKAALNPSATR